MHILTGKCLCGDTSFTVNGDLLGVISCHCKDCQRLHGNYNPMMIADKTSFSLANEATVSWYASSEDKQRGFCKKCGAAMFMLQANGPKILISAGCFDETSPFKNIKNIFTEEAGGYYAMTPEDV